tara:strand:- start:1 stop:237 length:237 start_codon:yes stop_codon:yes gene_type:complete
MCEVGIPSTSDFHLFFVQTFFSLSILTKKSPFKKRAIGLFYPQTKVVRTRTHEEKEDALFHFSHFLRSPLDTSISLVR